MAFLGAWMVESVSAEGVGIQKYDVRYNCLNQLCGCRPLPPTRRTPRCGLLNYLGTLPFCAITLKKGAVGNLVEGSFLTHRFSLETSNVFVVERGGTTSVRERNRCRKPFFANDLFRVCQLNSAKKLREREEEGCLIRRQ